MVVYILNYNSYFNRIVKREESLSGYLQGDFESVARTNFSEGDGVNTTFVANTSMRGNYLVVADDYGEIISRWFIMGNKSMRNGQYVLSLRRDLLADFYDDYVEQPFYCEKATLSVNDPMIFNDENVSLNRIKKSETLLSYGDLGWIVGYCQQTALKADSINLDLTKNYISVASIETWEYKKFMTTTGTPSEFWRGNLKMFLGGEVKAGENIWTGDVYYDYHVTDGSESMVYHTKTGKETEGGEMPKTAAYALKSSTRTLFFTYKGINDGDINDDDFNQMQGKVLRDETTGKFYKINIETRTTGEVERGIIGVDSGSLRTELENTTKADLNQTATPCYIIRYDKKFISLEETSEIGGDFSIEANASFLQKANDADYCIFAIPCPAKGDTWWYSALPYTYEKSMAIAQMLARQLQPSSSGGNLLDLQLLPYPIVQNGVNVKTKLSVKTGDEVVAEVYCCKSSSFNLNINKTITISDPKMSVVCDVYRLVSPNYSSYYEFSPAKNGGVSYFHVDCTYKPYTPYICVHPHWQGLYGQDFEDNRGLILGGDYSLPMTSDAFLTYQIQNKNYSAIFDRQMQSIDKKNAWGIANSATGAVAGTVQGAAMGAMAGPAGAIAGGVASAIGGAADVVQTASLMKESKDLQKDMFSYNLGNVDSKPNSLVKSSAFDLNYKMWPFIEFCTCTDEERTAVANKLRYGGMTVNRIGTIAEFLSGNIQYIKGQLIRMEGFSDDAHVANEIYGELEKGAYFE